jgi:hypothetical protein
MGLRAFSAERSVTIRAREIRSFGREAADSSLSPAALSSRETQLSLLDKREMTLARKPSKTSDIQRDRCEASILRCALESCR